MPRRNLRHEPRRAFTSSRINCKPVLCFRRTALWFCIAVAPLVSIDVRAQIYPSKPIRLVVGFLAGGAVDITARLLAPRLSDALGQAVIVENRPGAGGMIATETVAKSAGDGYTLLVTSSPDVVQPAIRKNLPFDLVRDFTPVSLVASGPFLLVVHPIMPAVTAKDLISLARQRPGKLNYASAGIGSSAHLSNELFNSMANVKIVHVPFKGTPDGLTAIAGGEVDMNFASVASAQSLLAARKIKALGVSTLKRFPLYADIPTIDESGLPGFERYGWYGITAPSKTPRGSVEKLNGEIVRILALPEMREAYIRQGLLPVGNTPDQFAAFIQNELSQTARLVKAAGTTAE